MMSTCRAAGGPSPGGNCGLVSVSAADGQGPGRDRRGESLDPRRTGGVVRHPYRRWQGKHVSLLRRWTAMVLRPRYRNGEAQEP